MPVKNGDTGKREGEKQKIDADRDVVSAEIGSEANSHVQGPTGFPDFRLSTQHDSVADEIVGLGEAVVEKSRRRIPLLRVPIEARPATPTAKRNEVLDQSAPEATATQLRLDEQILEIANRRKRPRSRMQDRHGEARYGALPFGHAPDHAGTRHEQALPGRRRHRLAHLALVEGDVAGPQVTPSSLILGLRIANRECWGGHC